MKITHLILFAALGLLTTVDLTAQVISSGESQSIPASHLQISDQMTTNLIFHHTIKSVDRGNRNILVQKADAVGNILQVKAKNSEMQNSNLTVITEDGSFFSFAVEYAEVPENLNLKIQKAGNSDLADFGNQIQAESELEETAGKVARKNRSMPAIRQRRFLTGVALTGIYIDKNLLYFQLRLENQTNIPYDIEQFRLFIRDNRQGKRSASQELEQIPKLIYGDVDRIPAQSTQTLVVLLPKFTIPDQKHLKIELMEENGGRHLQIKVKNRHLMNAMPVD
ncbi:Bacteroides conjugative transposon TraN protein [Algoriphagus locisalis]|uniref:Bacteroides conjugative transposon TraN protein n=1 Tax=Algoriphagus locisalis TaxID=305507 RepID=A0A1I7CD71_9BACT|nr:conjugative transposon protein TraN [Algoriphagus locisalis]SFT97361.1 Bacteroides conjugative transposon TraN protein [Algoriphagus locisalis]